MGASRENVTSNNHDECILDALKLADVFPRGTKKQGSWHSLARSSKWKRCQP